MRYLRTQHDQPLLLMNLDETGVPLFNGDRCGNVMKKRTVGGGTNQNEELVQYATTAESRGQATHVAIICDDVSVQPHLPQVIIAAVNGPAFGGGLALACAADIRVASTSAKFCSAFIRTGLSGTDIGITYLLPRLIGNANAFDLILTGRDIDAGEALRMGLVSRVVTDEELQELALSYARGMSLYTASGLRTTKEVLWHNSEASSLTSAIALEARNQNLLNYAPDVREYMNNYRKKTTG